MFTFVKVFFENHIIVYKGWVFGIMFFFINFTYGQFKIIKGRVLDEKNKPIAYANVIIKNTSIGTITNSQGQFELKVPKRYIKNNIVISYLGYSTYEKKISRLPENFIVVLKKQPFTLHPVEIASEDFVRKILKRAYDSIAVNYPVVPTEYEVFYQEKLSYKDTILYVAESMLQVNKSSYKNKKPYGQIKILESRKYENKIDTINRVAFAGGPHLYLSDDVKVRRNFLKPSKFKDYKYIYKGVIPFKNSKVYVIDFKSKKSGLRGTIYIDKKSYAYIHITEDYPVKDDFAINAKTTHIKKEYEYFRFNDRMHLKYCAFEFDEIDLITGKKLKGNLIFITTKIKDTVETIPYNQELLLYDIYRDKVVNSTESKWKTYNVLKEDTVFLSQKYFLSEKYNPPKDTTSFKYYWNKYYTSRTNVEFSLGFLPVFSNPASYSLFYVNNNKTYQTVYNSSAIDIVPLFGFTYISYMLTRHHILTFNTDLSTKNKFYTVFFNIGYSYLFKLNKLSKPVYFQPSVSYTSRKTGIYTGDFTGENNITVNKTTLTDDISTYVGKNEKGMSFGLKMSVSVAPQLKFFIEGSYFYSLQNKPIFILKEKKGFFAFRKTVFAPLDNNVVFKVNNIQTENFDVLQNNMLIKIGIIYGVGG